MENFRLPKRSLLRKSREFNLVYRNGIRVKSTGFALLYLPNEEAFNRLGISVHRKIRGVVRRNRIKRIIREAFRLHGKVFPQSCDIVITVNPYFSIPTPDSFFDAIDSLCLSGKQEL